MPTVEQLYDAYEALTAAKEKANEHEDQYKLILSAVNGSSMEKRLASQHIARFFKHFPDLAENAVNAMFDLCEDTDVSIRCAAIKELPAFCHNNAELLPRIADVLAQLLQSHDSTELHIVNSGLVSLINMDIKATLSAIFEQILNGEDIIREGCTKFLWAKMKTFNVEDMKLDVEEMIIEKSKEILVDVTDTEFVTFTSILQSMKSMQTLKGRQQLMDIIIDQARLDTEFKSTEQECVGRILQCSKQALPLLSKNVSATRLVTFLCKSVLPHLSEVTPPNTDTDIKLELLKILAELVVYTADVTDPESLPNLYKCLVEYMPLPPDDGPAVEEPAVEEPAVTPVDDGAEATPAPVTPAPTPAPALPAKADLQFSYVECLMFTFHEVAKKTPEFLTDEEQLPRLKDFRLRLQYFARDLQLYIKQLRSALQGKTGSDLKTDENKMKIEALKLTSNINTLIKDLFHNPPSYKSTITLSWKPVQRTAPPATNTTVRRSDEAGGPAAKKARDIYQPPKDKYSQRLERFGPFVDTNERRGGGGGRGRGRGGGNKRYNRF